MYLSSGSCRVPDFLRAGVTRFGIGVDGAASSNSANMMEEIRTALEEGRFAEYKRAKLDGMQNGQQ